MPESRSPGTGEDPLLDLLAATMAPPDCVPPETTVVALRRAVASMTPAPARRPTLAVWKGRRFVAVGAVAATLVLGTGSAFAAGVPVPPPIRILATEIGLPVTPQPVVDVQNAAASLQAELGVTPPDPARTATAAGKLSTLIRQLDPAQRQQVGALPTQVLHKACRAVFPTTGPSAAGVGGWPGCPASAPVPSAPSGPSTAPPLAATASTAADRGSNGHTAPGRAGGGNPSGSPTTWPVVGPSTSWRHPGTRSGPPTTSPPGRGSGGGPGTGPGTGPGSGASGQPGYRPPGQGPAGTRGQGGSDQPHLQLSPTTTRSPASSGPGLGDRPGTAPRTTPG
ncbi:MAG: hypothetical protein ABSF84_03775 [Acidimicrobiales bacterium]|jgi:hypothetical protein